MKNNIFNTLARVRQEEDLSRARRISLRGQLRQCLRGMDDLPVHLRQELLDKVQTLLQPLDERERMLETQITDAMVHKTPVGDLRLTKADRDYYEANRPVDWTLGSVLGLGALSTASLGMTGFGLLKTDFGRRMARSVLSTSMDYALEYQYELPEGLSVPFLLTSYNALVDNLFAFTSSSALQGVCPLEQQVVPAVTVEAFAKLKPPEKQNLVSTRLQQLNTCFAEGEDPDVPEEIKDKAKGRLNTQTVVEGQIGNTCIRELDKLKYSFLQKFFGQHDAFEEQQDAISTIIDKMLDPQKTELNVRLGDIKDVLARQKVFIASLDNIRTLFRGIETLPAETIQNTKLHTQQLAGLLSPVIASKKGQDGTRYDTIDLTDTPRLNASFRLLYILCKTPSVVKQDEMQGLFEFLKFFMITDVEILAYAQLVSLLKPSDPDAESCILFLFARFCFEGGRDIFNFEINEAKYILGGKHSMHSQIKKLLSIPFGENVTDQFTTSAETVLGVMKTITDVTLDVPRIIDALGKNASTYTSTLKLPDNKVTLLFKRLKDFGTYKYVDDKIVRYKEFQTLVVYSNYFFLGSEEMDNMFQVITFLRPFMRYGA